MKIERYDASEILAPCLRAVRSKARQHKPRRSKRLQTHPRLPQWESDAPEAGATPRHARCREPRLRKAQGRCGDGQDGSVPGSSYESYGTYMTYTTLFRLDSR